jgi:hypothetical protein
MLEAVLAAGYVAIAVQELKYRPHLPPFLHDAVFLFDERLTKPKVGGVGFIVSPAAKRFNFKFHALEHYLAALLLHGAKRKVCFLNAYLHPSLRREDRQEAYEVIARAISSFEAAQFLVVLVMDGNMSLPSRVDPPSHHTPTMCADFGSFLNTAGLTVVSPHAQLDVSFKRTESAKGSLLDYACVPTAAVEEVAALPFRFLSMPSGRRLSDHAMGSIVVLSCWSDSTSCFAKRCISVFNVQRLRNGEVSEYQSALAQFATGFSNWIPAVPPFLPDAALQTLPVVLWESTLLVFRLAATVSIGSKVCGTDGSTAWWGLKKPSNVSPDDLWDRRLEAGHPVLRRAFSPAQPPFLQTWGLLSRRCA